MPEINGYELIRQIRALPKAQKIPALAFTGFAYNEDQEQALRAGFPRTSLNQLTHSSY
jgi:CheY-like chemotaxis protein